MTKATALYHYDVVIIGGGIAGIAIAELLSRGGRLRIKLIENAPQLGTGASGKLEGWFHTGALYSGNDDAQTFMNCLNGIEDLVNLYSNYFANGCNFVLEERKAHLCAPAIKHRQGGWFNDAPVYYILPNGESPDIKLSRFKNDSILWDIQRQRVLNRLESAFGLQHNWLREGRCQAPSYTDVESHQGDACSLNDGSGVLEKTCSDFDRTFGLGASAYDVIRSADVSMNTSTIMRDLVSSALAQGAEFETGITIEHTVVDRFGPPRIKSIVCRDQRGMMSHLKAKLFIFAVGSGFKALLPQLNVRVRVKMSKSAMVVGSPAFSKINFARMSIKDRFHFNHLTHRGCDEDGIYEYSMLANSGFSGDTEDVEQEVAGVDNLLETAERYFGHKELYSRRLYSYDCVKTEFISEEDEKRRYSYWIEFNKESNYLCVLPGKFSFFPTVAYQTYLRIREALELGEAEYFNSYIPDPNMERKAKLLVADHFPLIVLGRETRARMRLGNQAS
jgi:hypothetical protein